MKLSKNFIVLTLLLTFALSISAQDSSYQEGFELFVKEKLEKLKLLVSTEKDVKKLFGKRCQYSCGNYNEYGSLYFEYIDESWRRKFVINGQEIIYKPHPKYVRKLAYVNFSTQLINFPKSSVLSKNLKCNKTFTYKSQKYDTRNCFDNQGLSYFFLDEFIRDGVSYKNTLQNIFITLPEEKYKEILVLDKQ
jgi:hypothetical protein